tara:strand:+ start:301 stop:1005 length:705 start_codon:yes stop_codon:yes gene_type:complete
MTLPKLTTPTYELELPSTAEPLKYRPWQMREQKILMIAQESEDTKQIEEAFATIIRNCTFDKIDPYKSPMFDIEYIFLQLRGKSVGEKIKLNLLCDDDGVTMVEKEIDLADVEIQMTDGHENVIKITDDIEIYMRYPQLSDMSLIGIDGEVKLIFEMIKRCILEIHDGETVHHRVDISNKELDTFLDSMSQEHFEKIGVFFETMPKLKHKIKVTNPKTKKKNEIVVEGLQNFFV